MCKNLFLRTDDWEVLYLEGEIFEEGHSIRSENLVKYGMALGNLGYSADDFKIIWFGCELDEELEEDFFCSLPRLSDDFPNEVKEYIEKEINNV